MHHEEMYVKSEAWLIDENIKQKEIQTSEISQSMIILTGMRALETLVQDNS